MGRILTVLDYTQKVPRKEKAERIIRKEELQEMRRRTQMSWQCALYRKVYETYYKEAYIRAILFLRSEKFGAALTERLFRSLTREVDGTKDLEDGKEWLLEQGVAMALELLRQKEKGQYQFLMNEILSQFQEWEEESYENVEEILEIVLQYASRKERRLFYIFMADIYEIPKSKVSEKLCLTETEIERIGMDVRKDVFDHCEAEWKRRGWRKRTDEDLEGER